MKRRLVQIGISAALLAMMAALAWRYRVFEKIRDVPPESVLLAAGTMAAAWLVNSIRWNILLRAAGVRERAATLAEVYFIGMFCSLFLVTGAGGDAVRMWDVGRRNRNGPGVVVATLQERLLGMGVSMVIGLIAVCAYWRRLPEASRLPLAAILAAAAVGAGVLLYPRAAVRPLTALWGWARRHPAVSRAASRAEGIGGAAAIKRAIERGLATPALGVAQLGLAAGVAAAGVLLSIAVYLFLARGVGAGCSFGEFCLVVPLVWVIAMTPSIGGLGVREGAFVGLMKLFSVPTDKAVEVAALYLIVNAMVACIGGIALARRALGGDWAARAASNQA